MSKRKILVYLSGPMDHASDSEMNEWRNDLEERWKDHPIIETRNPVSRSYEDMTLAEKSVPIVDGDLVDINECHIILVNPNIPLMQGTPMEMVYAKKVMTGKCVVLVMTEHVGPWMFYHSDLRVDSVEEAAKLIEALATSKIVQDTAAVNR
jgi:hypothetical protein